MPYAIRVSHMFSLCQDTHEALCNYKKQLAGSLECVDT